MSKRVTVNVPDDVADRLGQEGNVSAFVTETVRARMRAESSRAMMESAGFRFTDEGLAAARRRLAEGRKRMTPEVLARGHRMLDELRGDQ